MLGKMVRFTSLTGLGIVALFLSVPAVAAAEPSRLSPSTVWNVDYSDDSCRLVRRFGEGDRSIILVMDRYAPGDTFRLMLYGHPLRRARSTRALTLRFGPTEIDQRVPFREAHLGGLPALIVAQELKIAPVTETEAALQRRLHARGETHLFNPAPLDPAREEAVDHLNIDAPGLSPLVLETGSLGPPFSALRQCIDELLTHWDIDVERHRSLTRKAIPAGSPARWITDRDYPGAALGRGEEAIVHFRLIVDPRGRVSDCRIQQSTPGEAFRQAVCNTIARRAQFEPALDADGNPIQSYYVSTVSFRMVD
jgi:TonB family protein